MTKMPMTQEQRREERSILDALPASLAVLNEKGEIEAVNRSWRRFACENSLPDPLCSVGKNYLELCDRAGLPEATLMAEGIRRVLRGESDRFDLQYPCHSPTQQRWFLALVTPHGAHPRPGAIVMHLDFTVLHLAQETLLDLARGQARLAQLIEGQRERWVEAQAIARLGNWETEEETLALACSDEIYRILGTVPESIQPTWADLLQWVHPEERAMVYQAGLDSIGQEGAFSLQHRLLLADGSTRFVEQRWRVLRHQDGTLKRALGTCQDITERQP